MHGDSAILPGVDGPRRDDRARPPAASHGKLLDIRAIKVYMMPAIILAIARNRVGNHWLARLHFEIIPRQSRHLGAREAGRNRTRPPVQPAP
jgi:hypothetical protein